MVQKEIAIADLTSQILATYEKLGYSQGSAANIKRVYEKLNFYCDNNGKLMYSRELIEHSSATFMVQNQTARNSTDRENVPYICYSSS